MTNTWHSATDRSTQINLHFQSLHVVSPPRKGVITLELLVDDSTTRGKEIIADVRRKVHWLFVEKGEANPWGYAKYHCTTAANAYSNVHGGWVPASNSTGN